MTLTQAGPRRCLDTETPSCTPVTHPDTMMLFSCLAPGHLGVLEHGPEQQITERSMHRENKVWSVMTSLRKLPLRLISELFLSLRYPLCHSADRRTDATLHLFQVIFRHFQVNIKRFKLNFRKFKSLSDTPT